MAKPTKSNNMNKWKYLMEAQLVGLDRDSIFKLERAFDFCNFQFAFISCDQKEIQIKAPQDQFLREKICWSLGSAGFRNIESFPSVFVIHLHNKEASFFQGDIKNGGQ